MCADETGPLSDPAALPRADAPVDDTTVRCCESGITGLTIDQPCRFIPRGRTRTFRATGTPAGGSYSWSASGGISIVGAANDQSVAVRGDRTSATVGAATLTVTYRCGSQTRSETVQVTVFRITAIRITVRPTPPRTVRPGFAAPAAHVETISSGSLDFGANQPVVLMRCPTRTVRLRARVRPAGLPVRWHRARNSADHADLGGPADLPTLGADGADPARARLTLDQKGSFHIRPFVACQGDDTFDPEHAPRCLNLVLADATLVRDRSAAHNGQLQVQRQAGSVRIVNGNWGPAPLSAATLAAAGIAMELVCDVTGGGANGRLGLDQVFCGLINNVEIRNVFFFYRDNTVAPPTNHRLRLIAVSNGAAATGNHATWGAFFRAGDPAPVLHALPLLDTGLTPHGVGADTALMSRSQADPSTRVNRPVGQRWTTRCIDSPGTSMPRTHLGNPNAVMRRIDYQYRFKAAFCFWTNRSRSRAQTGHIAERTYTAIRSYRWEVRGVWDVTAWPAGALPTLNATTAHTIRVFDRFTAAPLQRARHERRMEVRPPSGVAAGLTRDAQ